MEKENEKRMKEQPTSTEDDVNTEVDNHDVQALLTDGFAAISNAMRIVGNHKEATRLWKGVSLPTALLWKLEELVEGMEAVHNACVDFDLAGDAYDREKHQLEVADAVLDGVGIDTMLLGCFGSERLREFADHYVAAQEARSRKPGFWYGPIRRAVGNIAYGVHLAEVADKDHARLQAKPRNRAMFVRNMLMTKSQKREWDTVVVPKPAPKAGHVVLTVTAEHNNELRLAVTIDKLSADNFGLTMDAIFAAQIDRDYVYGTLASGAKPALHGKKLSHFGNFKTLVKKALMDKTGKVDFMFKMKKAKASNFQTSTGKIRKLKAGDYRIEVIQ